MGVRLAEEAREWLRGGVEDEEEGPLAEAEGREGAESLGMADTGRSRDGLASLEGAAATRPAGVAAEEVEEEMAAAVGRLLAETALGEANRELSLDTGDADAGDLLAGAEEGEESEVEGRDGGEEEAGRGERRREEAGAAILEGGMSGMPVELRSRVDDLTYDDGGRW